MGALLSGSGRDAPPVRKSRIQGLRKRWLISSLGPIFVVALLVAGTFCVVMVNYYYNMMLDGLKTRAAHASDYFTSNTMSSYGEFYQNAYSFAAEFSERDRMELQFIGSTGEIIVSSYGLTAGMDPGTPISRPYFRAGLWSPTGAWTPTRESISCPCASPSSWTTRWWALCGMSPPWPPSSGSCCSP